MTKNRLHRLMRYQANLCRYRLTYTPTELEFWEYQTGFLEHARQLPRGLRGNLDRRREDNLRSIRNTVRRLVNANVGIYGYEPCFLTFTYKENMTDLPRAWQDWGVFMRKMRNRFGVVRALTVAEFQKRGAVHFHCIFFNLPPQIEAEERLTRTIAKLWSHGFVSVERIRSAKNAGAYVCKYLNKSATDARLRGKKFYTTTRNLSYPQEEVGDVAKNKTQRILEERSNELLSVKEYQYNGGRVMYYNYKLR